MSLSEIKCFLSLCFLRFFLFKYKLHIEHLIFFTRPFFWTGFVGSEGWTGGAGETEGGSDVFVGSTRQLGESGCWSAVDFGSLRGAVDSECWSFLEFGLLEGSGDAVCCSVVDSGWAGGLGGVRYCPIVIICWKGEFRLSKRMAGWLEVVVIWEEVCCGATGLVFLAAFAEVCNWLHLSMWIPKCFRAITVLEQYGQWKCRSPLHCKLQE